MPPDIPLRLQKWESDDVFRAAIGKNEFELSVVEKPRILVRLLTPTAASTIRFLPDGLQPLRDNALLARVER